MFPGIARYACHARCAERRNHDENLFVHGDNISYASIILQTPPAHIQSGDCPRLAPLTGKAAVSAAGKTRACPRLVPVGRADPSPPQIR